MDVERAGLRAKVEPLRSLGAVLRWAAARSPRAEFVDAVAMDEYTRDVVVRLSASTFLVFDTT
ncbi:MAG TPA: hypothetical protein VG406_11560 [Isosphaeraceae bacterium]|jgi:hypothetical protein|nr:hypothetical protein [Isosphaeraceae bacterium]